MKIDCGYTENYLRKKIELVVTITRPVCPVKNLKIHIQIKQ